MKTGKIVVTDSFTPRMLSRIKRTIALTSTASFAR